MALPETEREIPQPNRIEQVGEAGSKVERAIKQAPERAEGTVEQSAPEQRVETPEKPEAQEKPKIEVDEPEEKSLKLKELKKKFEPILAEKIANTPVAETEKEPTIKFIINEFANALSNPDLEDGYVAENISNIAYNTSGGDIGTYGWLQEKLESEVAEALKRRSIK